MERTQPWPGSFGWHRFRNDAGTRAYKLYVPPAKAEGPRVMIVMLHGCTQSADDFAAGTQMNRLADEHDFLVVYPEQRTGANASKCWNGFRPQDQARDERRWCTSSWRCRAAARLDKGDGRAGSWRSKLKQPLPCMPWRSAGASGASGVGSSCTRELWAGISASERSAAGRRVG
jgi:pimeloyl-ACP methyl ester carboxylesterase